LFNFIKNLKLLESVTNNEGFEGERRRFWGRG